MEGGGPKLTNLAPVRLFFLDVASRNPRSPNLVQWAIWNEDSVKMFTPGLIGCACQNQGLPSSGALEAVFGQPIKLHSSQIWQTWPGSIRKANPCLGDIGSPLDQSHHEYWLCMHAQKAACCDSNTLGTLHWLLLAMPPSMACSS
eukprot:1159612-Pelagomonas_calceolata.AAC.7